MATTIVLKADTDQAQANIDELSDEFRKLGNTAGNAGDETAGSLNRIDRSASSAGGSMDSMGSRGSLSLGKLASGAVIATAGMQALSMGFSILQGAVDATEQSMENWFRQSEHGEDLLRQLQQQTDQLKGTLFELLVGTDDVDEAFRTMQNTFALTLSIAGDLIDGTKILGETLADLPGIGRLVQNAFDMIGEAAERAGNQVRAVQGDILDGMTTLQRAIQQMEAASPQATLEQANMAKSEARKALMDALATENGYNNETYLQNAYEFNLAIREGTLSVEGHSVQIQALARAYEMTAESQRDAQEVVDGLTASYEQSEPVISSHRSITEEQVETNHTLYDSFVRLNQILEDGTLILEQEEAKRILISQSAQDSKLQMIQAQIDAQNLLKDTIKNNTVEELSLNQQINASLKDMWSSRDDILKGQQAFGASMVSASAAMISGEKNAGKAFMNVLGSKLIAEGSVAFYKGMIALAFGNPMGITGMAAGSAAMIAGESIRLGNTPKPTGAVTAGAAPPPPTQAEQQAQGPSGSIEIINNFGIATQRREVAAGVAEALRDADNYGMTRGLFGS